MSLEPRLRITKSTGWKSVHSNRANPPAVVSPDTPALIIWFEIPRSSNQVLICGTKPTSAGNPYP